MCGRHRCGRGEVGNGSPRPKTTRKTRTGPEAERADRSLPLDFRIVQTDIRTGCSCVFLGGNVQGRLVDGSDPAVEDLLRPAASEEPALLDAGHLDDVKPSDFMTAASRDGGQDAPVKAPTARVKALQSVDGGETGLGIIE